MIRFGPAGNGDSFYAQGNKSTWQAPAWLANMGLSAYEYSAGHGVNIKADTALKIGEEAAARGIAISIHAPYYINCAANSEEKRCATIGHFISAARAVSDMGGSRVIFHPGSPAGMERAEAMRLTKALLGEVMKRLVGGGMGNVSLCPETMGRPSQLGTLDEVLELCELDDRFIPTLDFGHLHAAGQGAIRGAEDFDAILARLISALGKNRARGFHAHFSRIEFTAAGEKRHHTFADTQFGPDYSPLIPLIEGYGLEPVMICESRGTQAEDAVALMMTRHTFHSTPPML